MKPAVRRWSATSGGGGSATAPPIRTGGPPAGSPTVRRPPTTAEGGVPAGVVSEKPGAFGPGGGAREGLSEAPSP